ncbi:hypothetical protein LRR80_01898 [Streptomyces sp. RO-S4]|nr:hypothetical protein [Streptomyces sp. RO-S4]
MALAPVGGVHHQLGGRRLHRVGVLQLGVADEVVVDGEQQVRDAVPLPATQLQPALLGHGLLPVGARGVGEQGEDRLDLVGVERGVRLERTGAAGPGEGVAGHAYEGKGTAG